MNRPAKATSRMSFDDLFAVQLQETELDRSLDRLGARRPPELAVHRDRLRFDGVPRDVEVLRDLAKRQMCGQQGQEAELRTCEDGPGPRTAAQGVDPQAQMM